MGVAGFNAVVKKTGTPTSMTLEVATTGAWTTVAKKYRINDATKRILDRSVVPTFFEGVGSTLISTADVSAIDYLFGTVTFLTTKVSVKVTGTYLPTTVVAGANSYTLNLSRDMLDDTDFVSTGWRSRTGGLLDVNLTIASWNPVDLTLFNKLQDGTEVVAEVRPGGSSSIVGRGFFKVESDTRSGDVSALESVDISLQLDGDSKADFSFDTVV